MPALIHILINHKPTVLPSGATLADALHVQQAQPPFAAAVNLQFVPRETYAQHLLSDGDCVEIIAPITGG